MRTVFLLGLLFITACSHSRRMPDPAVEPQKFMSALLEKNRNQKLVVICMQTDLPTNQYLETFMANDLKSKGFQAMGTKEVFKVRDSYTALELLNELETQNIKGIIEATFAGKITAAGVPEHYTLEYRELKVKRKNIVNNRYPILTGAIMQLITAMPMSKF